ncbi:MAG TPA: hypothetical protein PLY82_09085 [Methanosarcina thermophila]|nr:hypothetical protein [Methanosarcina thermophila]HOQ66084.1 hypothetical protein [Methanosarcina thermophila]
MNLMEKVRINLLGINLREIRYIRDILRIKQCVPKRNRWITDNMKKWDMEALSSTKR